MNTSLFILPKLNIPTDSAVQRVCDLIKSVAVEESVPVVDDIDSNTIVIAVGGDGTMIEAMRRA